MHEYSIIEGVWDTIIPIAKESGATRVLGVTLRVGTMTEVVAEAMDFMWEIVCEERGDISKDAKLTVEYVEPRSSCVMCGHEFDHDRFHLRCPECGSASTLLLRGRELDIASIEIETPEDEPAGE